MSCGEVDAYYSMRYKKVYEHNEDSRPRDWLSLFVMDKIIGLGVRKWYTLELL